MKLKTFQYSDQKGWDNDLRISQSLDSENTILFVFGSPNLKSNQKVFDELQAVFPKSTLVGCSGAGEIFNDHVFDDSLSVAVACFKESRIKEITLPISNMEQSYETGKKLAESIKENDLAGAFVISDGLLVNGSELVRGLNTILPNKVVTGGLAGDGSRFEETWIIKDGKPQSGYISAIGFYGDKVHIGHGSQGGWDLFGPERIVTKSEGNVLYELDGEPALNLYKQYLGEKAADLPASALLFPLQIRNNERDEKKIVRTILSVDESKQTMTFAGNIPQGSLAQLMRANFDRLIEGASGAATLVPKIESNHPLLTIAVSCVGRRLVLGERIDEEVEATLGKLPSGTQQVGFYSYGEISPYIQGQPCELHNQTMTLTTIYEDEAA